MLSVLLFSTNADRAGVPIHVKTLATNFSSLDYRVVIFGKGGPIADDLRSLGVSVYTLSFVKAA